MTRFARTTTRTLRNIAGSRGIVRLAFRKEMSVRVNAIGMRPIKKEGLPGENLEYYFGEIWIQVEATTVGSYGSHRPTNHFRFLLKIKKGETPYELIQRALSTRCKKYPIGREELQIL